MKSFTSLTCFALLFSITALGQEDIVKEIRKVYIDYNKKLEEAKNEGLNYWPTKIEVSTIQNQPALGPVNFNFTYYYDEHTKIDEEENDMRVSWAIIRKVVYEEGMPSYTDYKEILYDKNGKLLFYYSKLTGYSCGEKRFYFKNDKLIKIKFNPTKHEDCMEPNDFPEFTRYSGKLTNDDLNWQKAILEETANHKKAFDNLYQSMQ